MKRFYTFEPKNFRIFAKMKGFLAIALLMMMAVGNVNAQYQLVTDASQLAVGDQIIIAASGYDFAMSTTQNANNRGQAAITKNGTNATWTSEVEVLTLEAGAATGTFAFKTASSGKYLYAASSSSNYLREQVAIDGNASWAISFEGNNAKIVAQGTNTHNTIYFNNSSHIFSAYSSAQQAICIYKNNCPKVTSLTATANGKNEINFGWTSTGAEFEYQLNGTAATYTAVAGVNNTWTLTVNGLTPGTEYTLGVKAPCATTFTTASATTEACGSPIINVLDPVAINAGESYNFYGRELTIGGTYNDTVVMVDGCDSINQLVLTVNCTPIHVDTAFTICQGELPYTWGSRIFPVGTNPQVFPVPVVATFQTAYGCDSVVSAIITIAESFTATDEKTICENELPYTWNGIEFTEAGTQDATLTSANGCDSVVTMTLNVNMNTTETINAEIVENDLPYVLNEVEYTTTNTYVQNLQNANGCDSTITLNLTVYMNSTANDEKTVCDNALPYTWNGVEFTEAGTQSALLAGQGAHGEDSTVVMTLTVNPTYAVTDELAICDNELPYTWNGVDFAAAGTQEVTLQSVNGCDSVVTMTLTVNPTYNETVEDRICVNELPYVFNDTTFEVGTQEDTTYTYIYNGTSVNGCDSIVTLTLVVDGEAACSFDITFAQAEGGSIAGDALAAFGSDKDYTFTADDCYALTNVTLDGADVTDEVIANNNVLSLTDIQANHELSAAFAMLEYTVTATQTEGGEITATNTFNCGISPVYVVTPNEGYHTVDILVDGASIGVRNDYTFVNLRADHEITATFAIDTFNITATAGAHGTIAPAGTVAYDWHTTPSYTITPNACYEIATLTVNGEEIENPASPYVFEELEADATIDVTFQIINYELTWENSGNGNGTFNGVEPGVFATANCGEIVTGYPIQANEGSHISSVIWNNNPINIGGELTHWDLNIPMIVDGTNTTVDINFALNQQVVEAVVNNPAFGTATPATQTVDYGTNAEVVVTATADGYHIDRIVCGDSTVTYGANTDTEVTFTVLNVIEDVTVEAFFAINEYTITVADVENGSVVPNGTVTVQHGTDTTFVITPNDCYQITEVLIDDAPVTEYTFTNVTADHTLAATFAPIMYTMTGVAHEATMGEVIGGEGQCGETFTYTVNAAENYHVDSVKIGETVLASYGNQPASVPVNVQNVQGDTQLDAYFSINTFEVTATTTDGHGTVAPATSTVEYNGSQVITMTADPCYELTALTVNGEDRIADTTVAASAPVDVVNVDFSTVSTNGGDITNQLATHAPGWTGTKVYSYTGAKVRIGTASTKGSLTSPAMNIPVGATFTLNFDAKAWKNDNTNLVLKINGQEVEGYTGLSNADNDVLAAMPSRSFIATEPTTTITFEGKNNSASRVILDNIVVSYTPSDAVTLTVSPITEATEVVATFTPIEYTVTTDVIEGEGEITPSYDLTCGDETTSVTMTAAEGSHINYYTVNGTTTTLNTNADDEVVLPINGTEDVTVEVAFAINEYTVATLAVTGQGTFTPATQTVAHGGNATVTVNADAANGYHIVDIEGVTYGENTDITADYTMENVVSDTTIKANFASNIYEITVTNNNPDFGNVIPMTENWTHGQDASFTITPSTPCYYISEITVDGATLTAGTDYNVTGHILTFNAVVEPHTLVVDFTDSLFAMTATIVPGSSATVNTGDAHCGGDYTYDIEAADGMHLAMIFVDGVLDTVFANQEDTYEISFSDIHADHNIEVYTDNDLYTMTFAYEGAGSFNIAAGTYDNIAFDSVINFAYSADACQELASFTINGEEHVEDFVANAFAWHADDNAEIIAAFDTIVYNMTATYDETMGTVNEGTVNCAEDFIYTVEANEGYHIVSVAGVDYGTNDDVLVNDTITAAAADYDLNVVFAINTYSVSVCEPGNGNTLVADPTTVNHGDTANITITAATGYHITSINGTATTGENDVTNEVYAVNAIDHDTTICAEFALNNYTITVTANENGTADTESEVAVVYGQDTTVTFTANDCYYISEVLVDGVAPVDFEDSVATYAYDFTAIDADHTIEASFETYTYIVATSVNDVTLGTITATDTLNCGETFEYEVAPVLGQHIISVTVDGVEVTDLTDSLSYTGAIEDLRADHEIIATFGINHYAIVATAGENGVIEVAGTTVVEHGADVTYTITPNDCYYITEVLVDGEAISNEVRIVPEGMDYTFANIDGAHTIEANFDIYTYEMAETHTGEGTVTTDTVNCGDEYVYTIEAAQGWHIASYEIGGVTVYNSEVEPNDYNTESVTVSAARMDTMLTVAFEIDTYTVSACAAVNGTLVVNDPVEVDSNMNTTVTVTADAANGYHIVEITDNRGGQMSFGANTDVTYEYPVNNVDRDIEVCATFALNEFHITATAGENGTITPEGIDTIFYGETANYVIEPNHTCYYISAINVDGENVWTGYTDSVSAYTYTFTAADFDQSVVEHTIATEYTIFQYNMLSNAYTEGAVSSATVNCGTDYDYEITANTGYHIDHIVLDGVTTNYEGQEGSDVVTITDVQADHQLDAYFSINHYDIVASVEGNGTIDPEGTTDVEHFSSLTYTMTPEAPCYHVADVLVDGASVGAVDTYTFSDIDGPHTIVAQFAINQYVMGETHTGNGTVVTDTVECGSAYQYTMTADNGWHIANHTLGTQTYNLGHNTDVVAYRNVTSATQDTVLNVVFEKNRYNIDVTVNGNGDVTPGDTTVEFESNVDYTMTPATGYHVADVLVDGASVGAVDNYTFSDIAADHTMEVTFEANVYTINASTADENGTITIAGDNMVTFGESVNFAIAANECYNISAILVDGVADANFEGGVATYTYTMNNVDADHSIVAQFAINTYNVTVNTTGNGTATPATATYNCGDDVNFTFTPADGSAVESVVVNGQNIGSVTSYVINGIAADYTIDVTFTDMTYTLNAVAYNNGTITPAGESTVAYNGTITYTLTPDACQTVSEILVNGESYLNNPAFNGTTLVLDNIQSDMNIQAYFQVMTYNVEATQVEGGVITETGVYNCGTDVVYNITAADCYTLTDVMVDGASVGAVDTYTFSAIDADHTITATFEMNTYTITANAGNGGSIDATATFNCGETPIYTITPDEGYYIESVLVDGVEQGAIDSYTFSALNADHTIDATFAIYTYTVIANASNGVTISPAAGETTVEYGSTLNYTFTAEDCYEIVDVTVDGESVGAVASYDFTNIDANHIITVNAAILTYTIAATATGNGVITPAGETTVNCGASQTYTMTPGAGYVISDVLVDGASVGAVATYTFDDVAADATIEVIFTAIADSTYTITATATGNGTITPAGVIDVNYGASQTFTMTPDEFYTIAQVIVDGEVLATPVTSYTFANVTENHTIEVVFTEATCETPTFAWTSDITGTTATLNWTDMGATSYTIRYMSTTDANYTVITNITTNSYDLSGLTEGTEYVWNVKSVCVAGVAESDWSSQQVFQTEGDTTSGVGIENLQLGMIDVYSYGNNVYVVNNGNEQISNVKVFDMNGRMVYNGQAQSNPTMINVNGANGLYVVRVATEAGVYNYKVSISQR